ncbi:MAG: hypothetical protein WCP85_18120 [Mariniphaga sp.]
MFLVQVPPCSGASSEQILIKNALPVWVSGREKEMNLNLGFHGTFQSAAKGTLKLRITASTIYRVFLNGEFLGYGPARAAHGFFRIDEYDLGKKVRPGQNILAIEVAGYNVNTYYTMDQPSFLKAEVEAEGKLILATGKDAGFTAFQIPERVQKVERYSFQRPFTEYYRLNKNSDLWKTSSIAPSGQVKLSVQPAIKLLPRNILLPEFKVVSPDSICVRGIIGFQMPSKYKKDRSLTKISAQFKGYPESELVELPSQMMQEITNKSQDNSKKPYLNVIDLGENEFSTLGFRSDLTGFIKANISCSVPSKVVCYFDEMLTNGDVNTKVRMQDVNNQVVYELEPGNYQIETFEPYTFKYLKVIVLKGKCQFKDISLREYAYPENAMTSFKSSNNKLNAIFAAARQTFRQNAVDVLTDCPSRERAGWLCDSYFSAIMEKDFTGKSAVARNFYENYSLPDHFDFLPEGMVPMCYPADHNDGVFIPNWSLWFILQVNDFAQRGGDPELVASLKPRIEKLLTYFSKFENSDGLLEKLDSWIFVEWSKANNFVRDVNYPTNMLYSEALAKAGELYKNHNWIQRGEKIKETIKKQSWNGAFFVDNAVRNSAGKLEVTQNTTEVCQYYAFFFNVATPKTYPDFWKKLTTEFGPNRNDKVTYPNVFRANAFVGNYLRMDILSQYGLQIQLLSEIQDYFYNMARLTGTLWENMDAQASCDHGFASYLGHVLYRDILGVGRIDYLKKEITVRFTDIGLSECSGVMPIDNGSFGLSWKRNGNKIGYSIKNNSGYKVKVENTGKALITEMH